MRRSPRLGSLNPLRLLHRNISYQLLPTSDGGKSLPRYDRQSRWAWARPSDRLIRGRFWLLKSVGLLLACAFTLHLLIGRSSTPHHEPEPEPPPPIAFDGILDLPRPAPPYPWEHFPLLKGFYNGVRTLVSYDKYEPENVYSEEQARSDTWTPSPNGPVEPTLDPVPFKPYPAYRSSDYTKRHHKVQSCFLDDAGKVPAPDIYAYPGVPQHLPMPDLGSYSELGLAENVCLDRFGRFGPYGYGYNESSGGVEIGIGDETESAGSDKIFKQTGLVNYATIDWGVVQQRCLDKNRARFSDKQANGKQRVARQAFVLRTYTGFNYTRHQILSMRAMISELSVKSGGEYDVHLLVQVHDNSLPIWADESVYNATVQRAVPREFWSISTLWSEAQMAVYYPAPFGETVDNPSKTSIHSVYRSAHMPLQWFSRQHPEYDHIWNWEMDLRYTGHYYEFNTKVADWARRQPRKGLWERNARYWIPGHHGDYANFAAAVERETRETVLDNDAAKSGPLPVWGPVRDSAAADSHRAMLPAPPGTEPPTSWATDDRAWGVGEEADLLVFNPLFDPAKTTWVFRGDVTGYGRETPAPPRRAAIITVARLSRRLLDAMHLETWAMRRSMFPEMWPPSVALHHGLKAVYVPHPAHLDRAWDPAELDRVFNRPAREADSPFGGGEHNLLGSSFYYNAVFSGALWRRWFGLRDTGRGGVAEEVNGSGRMCLRPLLLHPVKHEMSEAEPGSEEEKEVKEGE